MSDATKTKAAAVKIKDGEFRIDHDLSGRVFPGFAEADRALRGVAARMRREERGYCKVWFQITWADGDTYEGRVDLTPEMNRQPTILREHVTGYLGRVAGRVALPGLSLEASRARSAELVRAGLGLANDGEAADAGAYLDAHDFGPAFT